MDRFESAVSIVKAINEVRNSSDGMPALISRVCEFFDEIKYENLSQSDLKFLKYISSQVGIPQYFDMLQNFQLDGVELTEIGLQTFKCLLSETLLHTEEDTLVHAYQKKVLDNFSLDKLNRFFLSASTSFGKTFLVYEIIRKMQYNNIVLIFPTIALLSENLAKIYSDPKYSWIKQNYDIHTLSDVEVEAERNILIYTPERFLSFMDKKISLDFDFVFVDEVYKMDNDYIIDEENKENERDVAYRLALFYALFQEKTDALLAGPYIAFSNENMNSYNPSFDNFLSAKSFTLLDYNEYEIVNKYRYRVDTKKQYDLHESIVINSNTSNKTDLFVAIVKSIWNNGENTIAYCSAKSQISIYARKIVADISVSEVNTELFLDFLNHLESEYTAEWIVVKALKKGVGIHHGLIPKYIQKEIIRLFNDGCIKTLLSTTTITEGVNTTTKNVIVLSSKKGSKILKKFDAKNIEGRAGRFYTHYSGRVIVLGKDNDFDKIVEGEDEYIKHKNYDPISPKAEIDLFHTDDDFLNQDDIDAREAITGKQQEYGIPDDILSLFKVISKEDKITLFERIVAMDATSMVQIKVFINNYNSKGRISIPGFESIIELVLPIVKNKKLRNLIEAKTVDNISILTWKVISYIRGGLRDSIDFHLNHDYTIDQAINESTSFIYSTLKYQVVKYLGAFNLMYKYWLTQQSNISFEDAKGIDALLVKFEYNSTTKKGRLASDFGVPQSIVDYYDRLEKSEKSANTIAKQFDEFERREFDRIEEIINQK